MGQEGGEKGVLMYNPNICMQKVRKRLEKSVFAQFENKDIFYTDIVLQ